MFFEFLILGVLLFTIGMLGITLNRRNLILMLMSIELILLAINFILIVSSVFIDNISGQLFAFYILVVAAGESAIGLSILIAYYRIKGSISVLFMRLLHG